MRIGLAIIWLTRHPMVAVVMMLGVVAGLSAIATSLLIESSSSERETSDVVATAPRLPGAAQHPPRERVVEVHDALHAIGRACPPHEGTNRSSPLGRSVRKIMRFSADFPSGVFMVDGERGTTISLLIVVRAELAACEADLARRVDRLIRVAYR